MIQFNLLPAVKEQYAKARRTMRLVSFISICVSIAAILILVVLLVTVDVLQKKSLNDVNGDITTYQRQLQAIPDLNHVLTVQNQLSTITTLHDQKAVASRLFGYIAKLTPDKVTISTLNTDFTQGQDTMTITGEASSLDAVNGFVDTLKATQYNTDEQGAQSQPAFSNVVLSAFGRDSRGATYTITLNFDPNIFSNQYDKLTLTVPSNSKPTQNNVFRKQADK